MSESRTTYLVGRIDRVVRARIEDALADLGLTLNELTALSVLAARPGLSNARLARRSLVSPQAMHKVMRSLEAGGLVERRSSPAGGRALETSITKAGRRILADAEPLLTQVEEELLAPLEPDERAAFTAMLQRVSGVDGIGNQPNS